MQGLKSIAPGRFRFRCYIGGTKSRDGRGVGIQIQRTWGSKEKPLTEREAIRKALDLLQKFGVTVRESGLPTEFTIGELAKEILDLRKNDLAPSWKLRLTGIFENHVGPFFQEKRVSSFVAADLLKYANHRLAEGVSGATVNRERTAILMVFNQAVALGLLERNPIPSRATRTQPESPKTFWFEDEEWDRLLSAFDDFEGWKRALPRRRARLGPVKVGAQSPNPRRYGGGHTPTEEELRLSFERFRKWRDYFEGLLWLAARREEGTWLEWRSVYLDRGVLRLRQTKNRKNDPEEKWKLVVITPRLRELLKRQTPGIGEARVFRQLNGEPVTTSGAQKAFALARKIGGLRSELTIHSIRHTVGYRLARAGASPKVIQEVLGHASLRMTARYLHLAEVHIAEGFTAIGKRSEEVSSEFGCAPAARSGDESVPNPT